MPNGYIPILGKPVEKCPQGHALFLLLPLVEKRGGEYKQALTPTGTPSAGVLCWGCLCDVMHAVVTELAERKATDAESKAGGEGGSDGTLPKDGGRDDSGGDSGSDAKGG